MGKAVATMVGLLLGWHGLVGLFVEGEHLFGIFNVDFLADISYLGCAGLLLVAGWGLINPILTRLALLLVGGFLVLKGLLGFLDRELWGLLPTGFAPLDFLLLFGLGGACLLTAMLPSADKPLVTAQQPLT